jgi:multisubunit Na+/H+ antiporter MnhC subunit
VTEAAWKVARFMGALTLIVLCALVIGAACFAVALYFASLA